MSFTRLTTCVSLLVAVLVSACGSSGGAPPSECLTASAALPVGDSSAPDAGVPSPQW
ncbi:MAG: hypothetical protein HY908_26325 [Myxococcales bacterium]|nr:hypothetical protein [Myxococcales bacterium]